MELEDLERRLSDRLRSEDDRVICAWIFGSVARGTARDDSDVDVAVLLRGDPARTLDGLELDLRPVLEQYRHAGTRAVQARGRWERVTDGALVENKLAAVRRALAER